MNIIPVILSGGFGTRLWPLSREHMPKQFNTDVYNPSFFTKACNLASCFGRPIIVANNNHRFLVEDKIEGNYEALLLEPESRNTAPAILAASLVIKERFGDDVNVLVLPSDHLILDQDLFLSSVKNSLPYTSESIITFGVKPTHPETGYGYIEVISKTEEHIFDVKQFKEKPKLEDAKVFISNGNFYWNAGIFLFKVQNYIKACMELIPNTFTAVSNSVSNAKVKKNVFELSQEFGESKSDSIDYAILEKIPNILLSKMLSPWSDVGSFKALHEIEPKDENSNVMRGNIQTIKTNGCFIQNNTNNLLTAVGLEGTIVIQTKDATLIAPLEYAQHIKDLTQNLKDPIKRIESRKVQRPWGTYEVLDEEDGFKLKKIIVKPKKSLSLQSHNYRSENWVVIRGIATVIRDKETKTLNIGESAFIPPNTKHRLQNLTNENLEIIEVQTGSYLDEDDIVRYEDDWGRV